MGRAAALALLMAVTGGWAAPPAPGPVAEQPGREPLRLVTQAGSVVASLTVPLVGSLSAVAPGERRTSRLRTTSFSLVALTWQDDARPDLRVRTRSGGGWGPWSPAPVLTDLPDAGRETRSGIHGTEPVWRGGSDGVQVSVRGSQPDGLALVLIDPGQLPSDRRPARSVAPRPDGTGAPRPELRSRDAWGADEKWRTSRPRYARTIQQVHLHHTATGNGYSRRDVPALIRGMYRYHTHDLGWSDLGYNFLVDRFGRSWVGRAGGAGRRVRGAHTLGFNHTSTGIAVIGTFEQRAPGKEVRRAVVRLAAWKLDRNDRRPQGRVRVYSHGSDRYAEGERVRLPVIDGHRDTNETACPGEALYDLLPAIRRRAQERVDRYRARHQVSGDHGAHVSHRSQTAGEPGVAAS